MPKADSANTTAAPGPLIIIGREIKRLFDRYNDLDPCGRKNEDQVVTTYREAERDERMEPPPDPARSTIGLSRQFRGRRGVSRSRRHPVSPSVFSTNPREESA